VHALEEVILAEARTEISYADGKASTLLAALGIGFGAFLGGIFASNWKPTDLKSWGEVAWWFGAAFALASVVMAALAVWPRYKKTSETGPVHFWGDVARFKSLDELEQHVRANPTSHRERTRKQMWIISGIVQRKYAFVRRAMRLAGLALVFFLVSGASTLRS
jgi:hypothetical protein